MLKIVAIEASLVAEAYALRREVFVVGFRESLSRTMMTNARPSCRDVRRVKMAWDLSCADATFSAPWAKITFRLVAKKLIFNHQNIA